MAKAARADSRYTYICIYIYIYIYIYTHTSVSCVEWLHLLCLSIHVCRALADLWLKVLQADTAAPHGLRCKRASQRVRHAPRDSRCGSLRQRGPGMAIARPWGLGCGCQNQGIPFWLVGAPPILESILLGIGMFTRGTIWLLTHGQVSTLPNRSGLLGFPWATGRRLSGQNPSPNWARTWLIRPEFSTQARPFEEGGGSLFLWRCPIASTPISWFYPAPQSKPGHLIEETAPTINQCGRKPFLLMFPQLRYTLIDDLRI